MEHLTNCIDKPVYWKALFDGGDSKRWSDSARAEAELGWSAKTDLDTGLRSVVKWYGEQAHA